MGIPILVRRHLQIQRAPLVWCLTGGKLLANSIKYICTTFIQLSTRYPFAYVLWWGSRPRLWNMTLKSTYYKNVLYHSLWINQPHPDYPCNNCETVPMTTNKVGFILLLVISLNVHQVLSQCTTIDFCSFESTRGISAHKSSMAKHSIFMTCPRACSLHPGCIATTYDSTTEICELHEAGVESTPCMTLDTEEGSSFWMVNQPERACPQVSSEKQRII